MIPWESGCFFFMKKMFFLLLLSVLLYSSGNAQNKTTLCINEIMQSNVNGLFVNQDFPDSWVELYNPTSSDISLRYYYLGLTRNYAEAYRIKVTTAIVPAGGYLVIYCDKENTGVHTNFRLESTKAGYVYLFNKNGVAIDSLSYAAMPAANIAYGRVSDGNEEWHYELQPTPGEANTGGGSDILLPAPIFSMKGHLMSQPEELTISIPENVPEDTRLLITFDGSEPNETSLSCYSYSMLVDKTTVVRAKLKSASALSPLTTTHSFIFHPRQTNLPILSMCTDDSYLFSKEIGITSNDTLEGYTKRNCQYDWRRPMNLEYYNALNEKAVFNQVGETAMAGGISRINAQKSFKCYANKRFETKNYKGKFWEDKGNVSKVKSFMLRNGGNISSRARFLDGMLQKNWGTHVPNLDWQAYTPVILYINGIYYGELGMRERSDEDYVEANYDGLEDIYQVTNSVYTGNNTAWNPFREAYRRADVTYEELESMMDVDNFMKYLQVELYSGNKDWPHNNTSIWRPIEDGGKWRWILKDLDHFIGNLNTDMFTYLFGEKAEDNANFILTENYTSRDVYKKLMSFPEFRNTFIDTYVAYLGDFLKPSVWSRYIDLMYNEIVDEMEYTYIANNMSQTRETFNTSVSTLRNICNKRSNNMYKHMANYFNLGYVVPTKTINNSQNVSINDIALTEGDFDGACYSDRNIKLYSGAGNYAWKMTVTRDNGSVNEYNYDTAVIDIKLNDYAEGDSIVNVLFETVMISEPEPTDFENKIASLGILDNQITDLSESTSVAISEPQCAYANIYGFDAFPTIDRNVNAYVNFYDNNGNCFKKKAILSLQESDGVNTPKKSFEISFCNDDWIGSDTPDMSFGSWVAQDEFLLNGFYNDGIRGTAEVAYKLYDDIIGVEEGARMTGDAFPCVIYLNGDYQGVYAWQLKKNRKNMSLAKDDSNCVWLDGTINDKQIFQGNVNWTKFAVRNPKDLYNMDGSDYDIHNPQELLDMTSDAYTGKKKQIRCSEAKEHVLMLSNYYTELCDLEQQNATLEQMQNAIRARFDVDNLINYFVFSLATNNYDGFSKKWQWYTSDGIHWAVAPYDCHLTFGYNDDATSLWPASKSSKKNDYKMENVDSNGPFVWIKKYFWDDVETRYGDLRESGVLSTENIVSKFQNWIDRVGSDNYDEEWNKWTESPCVLNSNESLQRYTQWVDERIALEDAYLNYNVASYDLAIGDAKWATICVPFGFEIPSNIAVYSVSEVDKNAEKILLQRIEGKTDANKPYLVKAQKKGVYRLSGRERKAIDNPTNGLLVGTYSNIYVPSGCYVMQYVNNNIGFYYVTTDNTISLGANRAYLCMPSDVANVRSFNIETNENVVSIEDVSNSYSDKTIYSVTGVKLDDTQRGINIIKASDGNVIKKFFK